MKSLLSTALFLALSIVTFGVTIAKPSAQTFSAPNFGENLAIHLNLSSPRTFKPGLNRAPAVISFAKGDL